MLETDSALRPKKPNSPSTKKNKNQPVGNSVLNKGEMTANDYHDKCRDLTSEVQYWKQKCASIDEQIAIIKQRFVEREVQYRGIIE